MQKINNKIIYLGRYPKSSITTGPETYSLNLFSSIKKYNEVIFIEHFFKDYTNSSLLNRLFGSERSEPAGILRLGSIKLILYLLKNQPDVIHILSAERFTIPIYLLKPIFGCRIITTFHSILKYELPRRKTETKKNKNYRDYLWEKLALKYSDKMIFFSQLHLDIANEFYNIKRNRIAILPSGVSDIFYNLENKIFNQELLKFIFYIGKDNEIDRGLEFVIENIKKIHSGKYKLYIIGKDNIKKYKDTNVEFVNPMTKSQLVEFMKDKHFIIKSNTFDTFSILTIEAMAAGLIPIVSDKVGISSYIQNEENGFVYSSTDNDSLYNILEKLFSKQYNLNLISQNAKKIIDQLSWKVVIIPYLQLYRK